MLYLLVYVGVLFVFYAFLHEVCPDKDYERPVNKATAIFWPITLPILLLVTLGVALGRTFK